MYGLLDSVVSVKFYSGLKYSIFQRNNLLFHSTFQLVLDVLLMGEYGDRMVRWLCRLVKKASSEVPCVLVGNQLKVFTIQKVLPQQEDLHKQKTIRSPKANSNFVFDEMYKSKYNTIICKRYYLYTSIIVLN